MDMQEPNEQVAEQVADHATEQWEEAELLVRPKWPKVIGIISIIWGALGLTCGGIGSAFAVVMPSLLESQLDGDPVPQGMLMHGPDYLLLAIGLSLTALLIFAGITAVSYRPLTRPLHLIYAGCSLPITVLNYLNQTAKQASIQDWAVEYPNNPIAQSMDPSNPTASIGPIIGLVMLIVLGFGVPAFYLIWFGLIKTKPEQITGGDEGVY